MSRPHNPRVLKVLNAMKALDIKTATFKPVLKRLLKLYDNKWELIEEDNYRTLLDAIFDGEDEKKNDEVKVAVEHHPPEPPLKSHQENEPVVEHDAPEPPLKKHHGIVAEGEASSTMENGYMQDMKNCGTPLSSSALQSGTSTIFTPRAPEFEAHSSSVFVRPRNNVKDSIAVNLSPVGQHNTTRWAANSDAHQVSNEHVKGAGNINVTCHVDVCESEQPPNHLRNSSGPALGVSTGGHPADHLNPVGQHSNASTCFTASHPQPASLSLFIPDISKETETVSISLVDEISEEKEPLPSFVYIPSNIAYQSAYVHVSLAGIADEECCSDCEVDCLSSVAPCACARNTGGEFAYTPEGLVKEEFLRKCILMYEKPQRHHLYYCQQCPIERAKKNYMPKNCKGHLNKRFIKECWRKCGCNMSCGNRVVQRGISRKLQVFLTPDGKGWGLRALEVLPKGAFVCEYIGEILTNLEFFERITRNSQDRHTCPALLDADWGSKSVVKDEDALCLDATHFGNCARFINHRCSDANLIEIPVEVENPNHRYYHLALFTKRKVEALEELTWDYHIDFADQNPPVKAFQCYCGSALCRDRKGKGVRANV